MPIYEYRCRNGHEFEVLQNMSDDPLASCEQCGAPVERVFHPVAVHFKGSGFYTTDYAGKGKVAAGDGDSDGDSNQGDSKQDEKAKSDSKSDSTAGSKSESSTSSGDSGATSKAGSSSD